MSVGQLVQYAGEVLSRAHALFGVSPGGDASSTSVGAQWADTAGSGAAGDTALPEGAGQLASMLPSMIPAVLGAAGGLLGGLTKAPEALMQAMQAATQGL